jgi:hypothetical protein
MIDWSDTLITVTIYIVDVRDARLIYANDVDRTILCVDRVDRVDPIDPIDRNR